MSDPRAPDHPVDPLTRLAIKHGTDKWGPHFYAPVYHSLFCHLRDRPIRLLEIGIGGYRLKSVGGCSLAMWAEYFPHGRITGIDIEAKELDLGDRVTVLQGSQDDTAFLAAVAQQHGPFDIIIDDGSHIPQHVVTSFHFLFQHLAADGIYVIEDVQTSYWPRFGGSPADGGGTIGLARSILDYLNHAEIKCADPARTFPAIAGQICGLRAFHNILVIEKGDNSEPSNFAYHLADPPAARALRIIERELECTPTPEGIANLAGIYSLGADHAKARRAVEEALARWPENPHLLSAGLLAAQRSGDLQERVGYLERLIRLEPDNAALRSDLEKVRSEMASTSAASGQPTPSHTDTQELLERATEHHRQGRLAEAEPLYAAVLAAEPQNFDALNRLGILRYQRGELEEARQFLLAAIARNPQSATAFSNLASVLLGLKLFDEALTACDRALALSPDAANVLYNRGHVLLELGRFEEALACYERVLSIRPDDRQAMSAKGRALLLLNRAEDALAAYQSALALNRQDADTWYNCASVLLALNRPDEAVASCERALAINPDHRLAVAKLGSALLALGRDEEALRAYGRVLASRPDDAEMLASRGIVLLRLKRHGEALASFDGALAAAPDSAAALFGRGSALMELQRWPEALESLDKLLAAAPQHLAALRRRGNVLLELKRFDEALTSYDRALTIAPEDADTLNNRALALLALNRQDEALADLDKALAAKPDDADTWYNSGNVLAALNRFEEALARYDRALAIDPRRATFHNNRGNALRKLDRLEEALASYDGALAIAPDLTDAHYNRGNALVALRRDEEALASYARVLAIEPKHLPARWAMVMHSIPVAAGSREEMEAGRKAFAAGLEDLAAHLADGIDAESAVYQAVPFYLAYHEENNRALYARYGELCVRATGSRPLAERPPRPSSPRLRLGIVSAQVRRHSVWDALLKGIVRHLDPNRIEIDIFHLGALTDAETEWAASRAAHFEQGPHEPRAWVERILARRPDVLLYPEIGMELTTMHLASQRLADVQAATWGHPHTTGLPTIDYFFSAEALEPPDAQDHYTERLVRLPRLGCCFSATELEASPVDLRTLGIEPDRPLLLSPGTPYKYAPQYDWVFPAIAKRLSRCTIAFFKDASAPWSPLHDKLLDRLSAAFAAHGLRFSDHCVVLPWLDKPTYYGLMQKADIMLDTIGFSGFNTAMQAVECGLPIVTREGRFMRGRLASGILRTMGLPDVIAGHEQAYVDLAVALGADAARRQSYAQRIVELRGRLFEDVETVHAFEDHLLKLVGR